MVRMDDWSSGRKLLLCNIREAMLAALDAGPLYEQELLHASSLQRSMFAERFKQLRASW